MAKLVLSDIENALTSKNTLNANFLAIGQELQNRVLYRSNPTGEPNTLENDLDVNSHDILNVNSIDAQEYLLNGIPLTSENYVTSEQLAGYVTHTQLNEVIEQLLAIFPQEYYTIT